MFARKKDSATISERDPVFEARYLGNVETFSSNGKGCAIIPVRNIWENSESERHLKKVIVVISASGITVKSTKKDEGKKYTIENITFCNADKSVNERIFCWIWKVPGVARLECHAVLCRSRETAQAMALVLSRAFQLAYKDWRVNRGKQIRARNNSLLQEKHTEDQADPRDKHSDACRTEGEVRGVSGDIPHNGILEKRRSSATSNTSGFASSVILDPEEEEIMERDTRVQAIVGGEGSDQGSE